MRLFHRTYTKSVYIGGMLGVNGGLVTVGDLLLGRLHDLGVRHVFGVPGEFTMGFTGQVLAFDGIDWVGSSSEVNACFSADGYARVAGLGVIVSQFGAGELSSVNAMATAMVESVPIVSIVIAPSTEVLRERALIRHSLVDSFPDHWVQVARQVTVAQTSLTPECALREIDRVLAECWSQRRPVYIRVPADVARTPVPQPSRRLTRPDPISNSAQLDAFAVAAQRRLADAERPALLVGNIPIRLGLGPAVAAFAAEHNWPVATQAPGRGLFDESDRRFVGVYSGSGSRDSIREVVEGADVLVCMGVTFFAWNGLFAVDRDPDRIISLERDSAEVTGTRFGPISMAAALGQLHEIAPSRASGWPSSIAPSTKSSDLGQAGARPICHERLWPALQEVLRPGDILAGEVGTSFFGLATMRLPAGVTVLMAPNWGAVGYVVPASFGAGVAMPERRVVSITGDGGLQMSSQEISRMLNCGQCPIIFVINNRGYTSERAIGKEVGRGYGEEIPDWRYRDLPAVFAEEGTFSVHIVRTEAELAEILAGIEDRPNRLILIEVMVDPADVPEGMQQWSQKAAAPQI